MQSGSATTAYSCCPLQSFAALRGRRQDGPTSTAAPRWRAIPGSALADWRSVNDRAPQLAGAATHPEQAAAKRLLRHPPAARTHGSWMLAGRGQRRLDRPRNPGRKHGVHNTAKPAIRTARLPSRPGPEDCKPPAVLRFSGSALARKAGSAVRLGARHGDAGWSSPVARQAHNLKVAGSNPAPATIETPIISYRYQEIIDRKTRAAGPLGPAWVRAMLVVGSPFGGAPACARSALPAFRIALSSTLKSAGKLNDA